MNASNDTTRQIIVRRDFTGGTNYSYTAGWFFTAEEAAEFVTRLTGGGTWVMEALPCLADAIDNGAGVVRLAEGIAP